MRARPSLQTNAALHALQLGKIPVPIYNTEDGLTITETSPHEVVGPAPTSDVCPTWQTAQLLAPVTKLEAELAAATDQVTRERVARHLERARATAAFGLARLGIKS
jgi:hypothetical protein